MLYSHPSLIVRCEAILVEYCTIFVFHPVDLSYVNTFISIASPRECVGQMSPVSSPEILM